MNKFPKRVLFISMLLIVNILMLASCKSKDIYDDENLDYTIDINNENAKVLSIKDVENYTNEMNLYKVIKNTSDFSIYNILITLILKVYDISNLSLLSIKYSKKVLSSKVSSLNKSLMLHSRIFSSIFFNKLNF